MLEIINTIVSWTAVFFRAGGMLAKNAMTVKWLVSIGNLGWAISGMLTGNIPLIVSNVLCLVVMAYEIIKSKRESKNGSKTSGTCSSKD